MERKIINLITEAKNKIDLYKIPRSIKYKNCVYSKNLNVVVIAAPCHGFGDVIFASKFANYLKSVPYSNRVSIITPTPKMFKQLGATKGIKIISIGKNKRKQCRRLQNYKRPNNLKKVDLIFIAPLIYNFDISYRDVREFIKESNPFNTIFLSEYQDDIRKGFDIPTGIGNNYFGLLFDNAKPSRKLKQVGNIPYALAYIARGFGIPYCINNFVKMIAKKYYRKYPKLQIVMSESNADDLFWNKSFRTFIRKYYSTIILKVKNSTERIDKEGKNVLILRGDVLPVNRSDMLSLMKYSIPDILVTGDQSITDVIDCCYQKNIWYQVVPWKRAFAKKLGEELPQKYLLNSKTACGTLKAVNWNKKQSNFKSRNDFRKNARPILNTIFCAASEAKHKNTLIHKYLNQLKKSSNKEKLISIFEGKNIYYS